MWSSFALNLLFSPDCLCCHYHKSTKTGLCQGCFRDLAHIRYGCRQCGLPVSADHVCACKDEDWPFSHCLSACAYSFPVDALIAQLKTRKRLSVCASLAELIVEQVQQQRLPLPELLLPAPSHADKLRLRGFNPAAEIAAVVGKRLHLPVDKRALTCNSTLASQKTLSRKQRSLNVDGGFSLQYPLSAQRVALIDDVLTTGATTRALAYLLREHGVHDIQVWTVARTLPAGFFG